MNKNPLTSPQPVSIVVAQQHAQIARNVFLIAFALSILMIPPYPLEMSWPEDVNTREGPP